MCVSRFKRLLAPAPLLSLLCLGACSAAPTDQSDEEAEPELASLAQALTSPLYGTVTYLGDIPSNKTTDWFQHAQGVALGLRSGKVNLFFSTNDRLYGREAQSSSQFGVSQSMPAVHWEHGIPRALSDLKLNHFGDLDFEHTAGGDVLLVPMERNGHDLAVAASFVVSDPNFLVFNSYATLAGNRGEAPWIAAPKADPGRLYSSRFNTSTVVEYRDGDAGPGFRLDGGAELALVSDTYASVALTGVQGGEFNLGGRLFLIAEGPRPGVYGFQLTTNPSNGARVLRQFDFYPATLTSGRNEEFEGITVGLIDPPGANDRSQVHVVLNQDGDIFFKHWVVSQRAADFTLP